MAPNGSAISCGRPRARYADDPAPNYTRPERPNKGRQLDDMPDLDWAGREPRSREELGLAHHLAWPPSGSRPSASAACQAARLVARDSAHDPRSRNQGDCTVRLPRKRTVEMLGQGLALPGVET